MLKVNKKCVHTFIGTPRLPVVGWSEGEGLLAFLTSCSPEVCVTVQEVTPSPEKVEALPCYLIHLLRQSCKVISIEILPLDCLGTKPSFTAY